MRDRIAILLICGVLCAVECRGQSVGQLVWQDEFDGQQVDIDKWHVRYNGPKCYQGSNRNKAKCLEIGKQYLQISEGKLQMTLDEHDQFVNRTPKLAIATKQTFNRDIPLKYEVRLSVLNSDGYSAEVLVENSRKVTGIAVVDFERESLGLGVYNAPRYDKLLQYPTMVNYGHSNTFSLVWNGSQLQWSINGSTVHTYDYIVSNEIDPTVVDLLNQDMEILVQVSAKSEVVTNDEPRDPVTVNVDYIRVYNYTGIDQELSLCTLCTLSTDQTSSSPSNWSSGASGASAPESVSSSSSLSSISSNKFNIVKTLVLLHFILIINNYSD